MPTAPHPRCEPMGNGNLPLDRAPGNAAAALPLSAHALAPLAAELDLQLSLQQCDALIQYAQLLRRWNRVHNLTAIDTDTALLTHHLLDCLAIVQPLQAVLLRHCPAYPPAQPLNFLDAGSGAGLPGIPLAIALPHWHGLLVDAVQKKCAFLQQAQVELRLPNLQVRHARLESAKLGKHALIVSRAFASLRDFITLTRPLLHDDGIWVAMKGRSPDEELADLPADVQAVQTITLHVPHLAEQRHLVVLRPVAAAPGQDEAAGSSTARRR